MLRMIANGLLSQSASVVFKHDTVPCASQFLTVINKRMFSDNLEFSPKDKKEIQKMVDSDKIVLFMKGDREQPQCGFSNLVCKILNLHAVPYTTYNVLEDQGVREGVKKFSEWPTIPQVYVNGHFVGGSDIMLDMHQRNQTKIYAGELIELFKKEGLKSRLEEEEEDEKK